MRFGQFNITSGEPISIKNILDLCAMEINKEYSYELLNDNIIIEPEHTLLDTKDAKEILGFIPSVSLVTMINKTAMALMKHHE